MESIHTIFDCVIKNWLSSKKQSCYLYVQKYNAEFITIAVYTFNEVLCKPIGIKTLNFSSEWKFCSLEWNEMRVCTVYIFRQFNPCIMYGAHAFGFTIVKNKINFTVRQDENKRFKLNLHER